ncbi:MAG: hypothetical protein H7Z37_07870 [Pyrinomonadaceae bacterium]|nr:hypothetical protein [Pyrinomonadaceae bacterium]
MPSKSGFIIKIVILIVIAVLSAPQNVTFAQTNKRKKPAKSSQTKTNSNVEKAVDFELKDQFNKVFTIKFPSEKPQILIFGDREGAEQIESWVRPLTEKYNDKIDIYGIAELSSVPSLAKGFVRGIIKNKVKFSTMLDWKGDVSQSYGYEKGKANIFLVDKTGRILLKETGEASVENLKKFNNEINGVL